MTSIASSAPAAEARADLVETGWRRLVMHILIFVIIIGSWEIAGIFDQLNELLLPRPSKILYEFGVMWFVTGRIYWHFFVTSFEAAAGFAIGVTIGMSIATIAAISASFRRYIAPYAVVFNVTPGIAVAPLVIAWFGFGWSSKIALATITCFFAPFINTLTGFLAVDVEADELFRSMRANRVQYFWKLQFPSALPLIIAGWKLAITGALLAAIVAEFFSASEGVGILMQRFAYKLDISSALATLLSMSLMGLMFFTIAEILDYRILYWKRDARMQVISKRRKAAWKMD